MTLAACQPDGAEPTVPSAVIVDQLVLTIPDNGFVGAAADMLVKNGYRVDYVPGEAVTVDFYKDLPRSGYDLVILRTHVARFQDLGELTSDAMIFTGEPYSDLGYDDEQTKDLVGWARYGDGSPPMFGILPTFVLSGMRGSFDGATVIVMGCDGLRSQSMSQALIDRGAGGVVGWSASVTPNHSDRATLDLLHHIVAEHQGLQEAVAATERDIGDDPIFGARLEIVSPND